MKSNAGEEKKGLYCFFAWLLGISLIVSSILVAPPQRAAAQEGGGEASFTVQTAGLEAEGTGENAVELAGPARAGVGERVTFTLYGRSLRDLGGFHAVLRFDPQRLDFAAAELSPELLAQGSLLMVGPVEQEGTVHLGAASCPSLECSQATVYEASGRSPLAAAGDLPLATFAFYVRQPGANHLSLDELNLFDAGGAGLNHTGSSLRSTPQPERLDVTGNQFINDADAYALLASWVDLVKKGVCLDESSAAYDLDDSGCLDAADLQAVLAHWGTDIGTAVPSGIEPGAVNSPEQTVTFTVNSAGDQGDSNRGDGQCRTSGGACTLRAALQEANRRSGAERIHFNIRSGNGACPSVVTLTPASPLEIDDPRDEGITIDGYTQCGASPNSGMVSGNAVIKIELKGDLTPGKSGLRIYSSNNLVRGMALYHFSDNLVLSGRRARNNRIEGNFAGTNAAQTEDTFIENDESDGILLGWGAKDNLIGGVGPEKRNIISGNDQDGLGIQGSDTTGNTIYNNYIGIKQDGLTPLGNKSDGIDLAEGASSNVIGGTGAGQRNVLSGNNKDGIEISHTESTRNNRITGNFIGLAADGASAAGNGQRGVTFEDLVNGTQVNRNVIVANGGHAIRFYTAHANEMYENFIGARPPQIGPDAAVPNPTSVALGSLTPMPNGAFPEKQAGRSGIQLTGGSEGNRIEKNVIANHPEYGIIADVTKGYLAEGSCNAYFNTFSQNRILNNGRLGIYLKSGQCDNAPAAPNQGIQPPIITAASGGEVRGTACPNCTVEVFISDKNRLNHPSGENAGEASQFVAMGNANGAGAFRIPVGGVNGTVITATATDSRGNTSQFANNVLVGAGSGGSASSTLYLPLLRKP